MVIKQLIFFHSSKLPLKFNPKPFFLKPISTFYPSLHFSSSTSYPKIMGSVEGYKFGPYKIDEKEVFYSTGLSYALVNLKPLLPVYEKLLKVCAVVTQARIYLFVKLPSYLHEYREVKRFVDLTVDETSDLWLTAQKVGARLENYHKASSLTLAIQDGPQAGQTVPHVHIHVLPRKGGDFEKNDEIYDALDVKEAELKQKLDLDKERKDRTLDEMSKEAEEYRKLFL
ncbi:hypothetical protein IFM89_016278 [Coptis chinensis]|uniref:Bis(5'-adenosyl)-triphosphatase n=1 Tax=Coptis chinensis TaxID=261450 RepID=A0A835LFC2_9MAGN|nr:hypothetical protein IFM89_016278 [Coptis chinensis]